MYVYAFRHAVYFIYSFVLPPKTGSIEDLMLIVPLTEAGNGHYRICTACCSVITNNVQTDNVYYTKDKRKYSHRQLFCIQPPNWMPSILIPGLFL